MPNLPFIPHFHGINTPRRHEPGQFRREPGGDRGWYQDDRKLREPKKANKAFIWPKDGRRGSTWGRVKDIVSGQGPDIFVAFGANKRDCAVNRPSRSQWSGHVNLDGPGYPKGFNHEKFAPWTVKGPGARMPGLCYDFRTRTYGKEKRFMWTDVIWQQEPYKNRKLNPFPEAFRDLCGEWYQDKQYLPLWLGGPVDNEFGRGRWSRFL